MFLKTLLPRGKSLDTLCPSFLRFCDKIPQTVWLQTTEISCLTVLEARSSKLRCQWDYIPFEVPREEFFPASWAFPDCWQSLQSLVATISASIFMRRPPSLLCVLKSLPFFTRTSVTEFRAHPHPVGCRLQLVTSANTRFPSSTWTRIFGGCYSTQYKTPEHKGKGAMKEESRSRDFIC